ncbi:MAG: transporter suffix domain-containing protein [Acidobacteria bacterium]|nr:transporter suffix domain-containing protein [Acidobacteriota bacterium]
MIDQPDNDKAIGSERKPPVLRKDWRFYTGIAALILSIIMPVFALLVPLLGLSLAKSAVIVGILVAGAPEVMALIAIALLGKESFQYFVYLAKKAFREAVIVKPASKERYYFGLILSLASWSPLYLYGYFPDVLPSGNTRIYILATADLIFIFSMFIMGGEFWGKCRRIFTWEGKV